MAKQIEALFANARQDAAVQVNKQFLSTCWRIGRVIADYEKDNKREAGDGNQILEELSEALTREFGKGFSHTSLVKMRALHLAYPNAQKLSSKLSWAHYGELLSMADPEKRRFYEKASIRFGWPVRELKRQMAASRLEGKANQKPGLKGTETDLYVEGMKDPDLLNFLGLPKIEPLLENDLQKTLALQIKRFLLESGRGFMFAGTRRRMASGHVHSEAAMVFYNKRLRAYVLVEFTKARSAPEAIGKFNQLLNDCAAELNDEFDHPPVGILLCTEKDKIDARYAIGGLSKSLFDSSYVSFLPARAELTAQVEAVLRLFGHTSGCAEDYKFKIGS